MPRRRALPEFAGRHDAAGRHVGERAEHAAGADRRVRADAAARAQRRARADAHRADDEVAIVELAGADLGLAQQRGVVADLDQVPPAGQHVDAAVQVDALADARAERPQRGDLRFGAVQQVPRHEPHQPHDDPVADVEAAPRRHALRQVAADQQLLAADRQRERDHRVGAEGESGEPRPDEQQLQQRELRREPRQHDEAGEPREAGGGGDDQRDDGSLHGGREPRRRQQRRQRRVGAGVTGRGAARGGAHARGERGRGAVQVDVAHGCRFAARVPPQSGDQQRGAQRVAAKREEVAVGPDDRRRHAQHGGERIAQQELVGVARRPRRAVGDRGRRLDARQALAVDLAADGARQFADGREALRRHVVRQHGAHRRGQRAALRRRSGGRGHDVRRQHLLPVLVLCAASDLAHALAAREHGFDGLELDAVAAHLDLRIDAAVEADLAVAVAADEVAGPVDAADAGQGREALPGQLRQAEVAAGQARTGDAQFAGLAVAHRLAVVAEDPGDVRRHRPADGHRSARQHAAAHHRHRALGRTIAVLQPNLAAPEVGEVRRQRLAADVTQPQVRQLGARRPHVHRAQQRRRRAEHGDALAAEPRHEVGPHAHRLVVERHHRRARREREPRLLDRRVVRRRTALRATVARRDAETLHALRHEVDRAAMLDQHALGLAGRARGVDRVRETAIVRPRGRQRQRVRRVARQRQRHDRQAEARGARRAGGVGQHGDGLGVGGDVREVRVGERRVDGDVADARLHGAELRGVEPRRRATEQHDDQRFAVHVRRDRGGDLVGHRRELAVGDDEPLRASRPGRHVDGWRIRVARDARREEVDEPRHLTRALAEGVSIRSPPRWPRHRRRRSSGLRSATGPTCCCDRAGAAARRAARRAP